MDTQNTLRMRYGQQIFKKTYLWLLSILTNTLTRSDNGDPSTHAHLIRATICYNSSEFYIFIAASIKFQIFKMKNDIISKQFH